MNDSNHLNLAKKIADQIKSNPYVESIGIGGSTLFSNLDQHSDIDIYIFTNSNIELDFRHKIVDNLGAIKADFNLTFWDLGDQWIDSDTNIEVDVIYWDKNWILNQIHEVLDLHNAKLGYTTSFIYTIKNATIMFDRQDWLFNLKKKCNLPYPKQLKKSIFEKNYPVLRKVIPSYYNQINKALYRSDLISLNHRLTAFFESYFDIIFAINETMNPGEKKIIQYIQENCLIFPHGLQQKTENIFKFAATGNNKLLHSLSELLDDLDILLKKEGFICG